MCCSAGLCDGSTRNRSVTITLMWDVNCRISLREITLARQILLRKIA